MASFLQSMLLLALGLVALYFGGALLISLIRHKRQQKRHNDLKNFYGDAIAKEKRVKNVLLVTAHPDDEAMFFVPSIAALYALNTSSSPSNIETPDESFAFCWYGADLFH